MLSTSNGTEVLLTDLQELLTCHACRVAPVVPPVHACRRGHVTCTNCSALVLRQCLACEEPLSGRNLPLDEVLLPVLFDVTPDLMGAEEGGGEPLGGVPVVSQGAADHIGRVIATDCYAQMLTSGRTVQCPFPCNLRITVPGLYRHFSFQHPEVFLSMLCKNHAFSINIPRQHLSFLDDASPSRCVYIFVVDIGDHQLRDEDKLVAMSGMNPADLLSLTHNMRHMLQRRKYLALLSVSRASQPDVYGVWVSALYDFSPVKYTLRYNDGFRCVSFEGRPKSLQAPPDTQGGCLALPSTLLRPEADLELTLVFHMDLPFPHNTIFDTDPSNILIDL